MRALQPFLNDFVADSEPSWRGPIPVWARSDVARFAGHPEAASDGGPNITVAPDSNAATGAASNPPNRNARHQSLCTNFVRDAVAFRFVNLKHVATENQFADVFTKAPTAPMLRLLKTLMDGAARIPLLARLYQQFLFHITTYASSRNTLSSKSTLDRLHTLHTQRCATYGRGDGISHPYLLQYR